MSKYTKQTEAEEKRRYPRVRRQVQASVSMPHLLILPGRPSEADTIDISKGGLRIRTDAHLEVARRVVLRLRSRFLRRMVPFCGRVVWVRPFVESGRQCTLAGISLEKLADEGRMMLSRMVSGNSSP